MKEVDKRLRPRQFEYHPSDSCLMAVGTLDGEVVVINHETGNILSCISAYGNTNGILGLCWLKQKPSKLLVGSDSGSLRLYDINCVQPKVEDGCCNPTVVFDDFEQLTSVHVNSTDDRCLTSGYSKKVAIYDICTGQRLQLFTDMHREPINVAKFANHSPNLFVTSSFDRDIKMWDSRHKPWQPCYTASSSRGNVMVVFSPDDLYLLVSAVDNEVKQLLAVDGRLHMDLGIVSTGSAHNYTRSYYMNGRDYIISGSCEEPTIRICCAQTGRRLRDISLESTGCGSSMFVQSLRSDPFRHFHMAVLAAYFRPVSKYEIIKVNLLSSSHSAEQHQGGLKTCHSCDKGG
ncbi:COMPASS-like H3K4 histone methylase component WDR5A isoform X2 [Sesamum indicum]|nr:COMPASS-like H3K4 histone methylase component WDR5A isoform X2 [Sesamum indicum]XP_020554555.1 COMPASS-like H3K4 histone methylase component WDR5A isoform X2 [Sesamum indicum]